MANPTKPQIGEGAPQTHAIQRAIGSLAIGTYRGLKQIEDRAKQLGLGEVEEQHQLSIEGTAGTDIAWDTVDVKFDGEFVLASGLRNSNLSEPHMTYGVRLTSDSPVMVVAAVMDYAENDRGGIEGATVAFGAVAPGTSEAIAYRGSLHVSFQGYGPAHGLNVDAYE